MSERLQFPRTLLSLPVCFRDWPSPPVKSVFCIHSDIISLYHFFSFFSNILLHAVTLRFFQEGLYFIVVRITEMQL